MKKRYAEPDERARLAAATLAFADAIWELAQEDGPIDEAKRDSTCAFVGASALIMVLANRQAQWGDHAEIFNCVAQALGDAVAQQRPGGGDVALKHIVLRGFAHGMYAQLKAAPPKERVN